MPSVDILYSFAQGYFKVAAWMELLRNLRLNWRAQAAAASEDPPMIVADGNGGML
jgi:hypothetical protein